MDNSAILAAFYSDPVLMARVVFPHWFPKKMPWFHRGIIAIMLRRTDFLLHFGEEAWSDESATWTPEDLELIAKWFLWEKPDGTKEPIFKIHYEAGRPASVDLIIGQFTAMMLPRGCSKTTLNNFIKLFKILFGLTKFTLLVSETATHANKQLDNIKAELESNERLIEVFGSIVPERQSSLRWTQDEAQTTSGVFITARGRGGQVRGLNNKGNRPDDVTVDDLEDEESVGTPEQLNKTLDWTLKALLPVLSRFDPNATATFMGTMLHRDQTLLKLAADERFTFIRFGAKLPDGSWLWPLYMDQKGWETERASYAAKGKLSAFYMEFGSEARDEDSAKFKAEWFVNIIQPRSRGELLARALVIDPAISNKIGADRCSLAVAGITPKGMIHLCDSYGAVGMPPREQVDRYFAMSAAWDCTHHGVESVAYQAALVHLLREEMFRKHRYFEITSITHKTRKTERIEGVLQPRYAAGYVTHQRHFPKVLEMLQDWPNAGFDDVDAFAMAVSLLDPFAALAADPEKDLTADEYEDLETAVGGVVRHAP